MAASMPDPIVILAAVIGLGAAANLACNVVSFVMSQSKVKSIMAISIKSLFTSPAGLAILNVGLKAIEDVAEQATTDPDVKKVETFAFEVLNQKIAGLASPAPVVVPVPAPAS